MAGRTKPCCGYPSRATAIAAMARDGLKNREIAEKLGISIGTVGVLAARERQNIREEGARGVIRLDPALMKRLNPAAEARGITPLELIHRLVATIADEGLTDAILDDQQQEDAA